MPGSRFKDEEWERLYPLLRARVARWVRFARVPLWVKQRDEIVEDIVQDAFLKICAYEQRVECGEARSIDSLESMCAVTAYHCYVDALRRDRNVVPLMQDALEPGEYVIRGFDIDPSELAIENIYRELLFIKAARWIAGLPDRQRTALLIDLANRMFFDPFRSTPLQKALEAAGIDMRNYKKALPGDKQARARHAAHLSLAYKRLALLAYMQRYTLVA